VASNSSLVRIQSLTASRCDHLVVGDSVTRSRSCAVQGVMDPRDVAGVAVVALTEAGHSGQTYTLWRPAGRCAAVGDGRSDVPLFTEIGLAIALNATPAAARATAHVSVDGTDLRTVLPLLSAWLDATYTSWE
jgi:phosphoserine phosphatase